MLQTNGSTGGSESGGNGDQGWDNGTNLEYILPAGSGAGGTAIIINLDDLEDFDIDGNGQLFTPDEFPGKEDGMPWLWWKDEQFLSDTNNFNLDIDAEDNQYNELTAAEKVLIGMYPLQAVIISKNIDKAFAMSDVKYGINGGLNDKKDAFRHAYFNALNARDVTGQLYPFAGTGIQIVISFAEAHESEVPTVLHLEKEMDLHNNQLGINYCLLCVPFINSDQAIADDIYFKIILGEGLFISPLDPSRGLYDANRDKIQDCSTCTNGIVPGVSKLIITF